MRHGERSERCFLRQVWHKAACHRTVRGWISLARDLTLRLSIAGSTDVRVECSFRRVFRFDVTGSSAGRVTHVQHNLTGQNATPPPLNFLWVELTNQCNL